MDLLQREGLYPLPPQAPETMGVEFSGVIESFGTDGHEDFKVGDAVFGLAYGGMFQLPPGTSVSDRGERSSDITI